MKNSIIELEYIIFTLNQMSDIISSWDEWSNIPNRFDRRTDITTKLSSIKLDLYNLLSNLRETKSESERNGAWTND